MNTTTEEKDTYRLSDEEIVSKVLAGEQRLYAHIMRRHNARLYRVCMSITGNDADAEDIMQVAYIKAYQNLHTFRKEAGFATWLTRILINECLYQMKKNKRHMSVAADEDMSQRQPASGPTPAGTLLNRELGAMLEKALLQLPEKYRLVFVLREVENLSIAETVDTLNITEANVKVRLNRAKSLLRDSLSSYYKNDGIFPFHLSRCDRIVNNVMLRLGIA